MGTEAFYTTAAQVLSTLLIALVVELGFITQAMNRRANRLEEAGDSIGTEGMIVAMNNMVKVAIGLAVTFFAGELLAFLPITFRWFNIMTCLLIGICLLLMVVAAAVVPIVRIREVDSAEEG